MESDQLFDRVYNKLCALRRSPNEKDEAVEP